MGEGTFAWETIVLATRNRGKIAEFEKMFAPWGIRVRSVFDYSGVEEVEEDGATFQENAIKKAKTISHALGLPALADDSGLEVDALNGAPGVYSARFAGPEANDQANNRKLLELMSNVPEEKRSARFRCVLVLAMPTPDGDVDIMVTEGTCEGQIAAAPQGEGGFGYDPLFYLPALGKTMAELDPVVKNSLSHRGNAMRNMERKWRELFSFEDLK